LKVVKEVEEEIAPEEDWEADMEELLKAVSTSSYSFLYKPRGIDSPC
jgi:hypothetical protein